MKTATKKPAKKTAKKAAAISNRLPAIGVETDGAKGQRTTKHFDDPYQARRYFAAQDKKGKAPKVVAGELAADAPATASNGKPAKAPAPLADAPPAADAKPPKAAKPAGVQYGLTATYGAGLLIKARGLPHGVTEDMVVELGNMLGRQNPHQDWFSLKNAWHVARALAGEPAEGPAAAAK